MRFRKDIEGLRAVAVVVVVLFHAGVPGFSGGFVGVDVFFVISGFLITGLLLRDDNPSALGRIRHFYARRVRRILPAATLAILLTLAGAAIWQNPLLHDATRTDAISAMFFFSNVRFYQQATDYFAQDSASSLFQHFWSLSVEEQFYVLWPALLVGVTAVAKARQRAALIAVIAVAGNVSFLLGAWLTTTDPPLAFFLLPARAWELCVGAILALIGHRIRMSGRDSSIVRAAGLLAIGLAVIADYDDLSFPGVVVLLPVLGAALVIIAGLPSAEHEGRLLTPRVMQLGGRYSYSWYLWHWPALLLVSYRRPSVLTNWGEALVVMALVALPGAMASFHLVEHPFRATFNRRPDTHSLLAGVALMTVFVVALVPYNAAGDDTTDAGRRVAAGEVTPANATDFVPTNLRPPLAQPGTKLGALGITCAGTARDCVTGDPSSTRTVVLFGDSHANHWVVAFARAGQQQGWRVVILGSPGCRSFVEPPSEFGENCDAFRAKSNARIAALRPNLVVMSNQSSAYFREDRGAWSRGVGQAIDVIPDGVPVAVLSQTPRAAQRVPLCLADHVDDTTVCEPKRQALDTMNHALRRVVTDHGAAFVDLTAWFCEQSRCPVIMSNVLVYRDRSHLTAEFTETRVAALAGRLAPLLGTR